MPFAAMPMLAHGIGECPGSQMGEFEPSPMLNGMECIWSDADSTVLPHLTMRADEHL